LQNEVAYYIYKEIEERDTYEEGKYDIPQEEAKVRNYVFKTLCESNVGANEEKTCQ